MSRRLDLTRCVEVSDAGMVRLAAYTRQHVADADEEGGEGQEFRDSDEEGAAAAAAVESMQLSEGAARTPQWGGKPAATPATPTAAAPAAPAMESPESAVRRIATQRHEAMMARTASAGGMGAQALQQGTGMFPGCIAGRRGGASPHTIARLAA